MSNNDEAAYANELGHDLIKLLTDSLEKDGYMDADPLLADNLALTAASGALALLMAGMVVQRGAPETYIDATLALIKKQVAANARNMRL